ncbi:MAG: 5'-nucleotidase C-terminal domain-containing protein [Candidatus Schekmanbacteria bacterium]|nr:5'-nucleotidase C-terminal domain-containing protein [Candidatus Schekmanbacteria bacterium]
MKRKRLGFLLLAVVSHVLLFACDYDPLLEAPASDSAVVGFTSVDLDANKAVVRAVEAPLGNLVADALAAAARSSGVPADLALMNGGGIRFNTESHPTGVFAAGVLTRGDVGEMLPFGNTIVVAEVTGQQLLLILERSVAALPAAAGAFLQVSRDLVVDIDTAGAPQIVDTTTDPPAIVFAGERIRAVSYRGAAIAPGETLLVATNDFLADGGDGYVAFREIPAADKQRLNIDLKVALEAYLQESSPVSPAVEGRLLQ